MDVAQRLERGVSPCMGPPNLEMTQVQPSDLDFSYRLPPRELAIVKSLHIQNVKKMGEGSTRCPLIHLRNLSCPCMNLVLRLTGWSTASKDNQGLARCSLVPEVAFYHTTQKCDDVLEQASATLAAHEH